MYLLENYASYIGREGGVAGGTKRGMHARIANFSSDTNFEPHFMTTPPPSIITRLKCRGGADRLHSGATQACVCFESVVEEVGGGGGGDNDEEEEEEKGGGACGGAGRFLFSDHVTARRKHRGRDGRSPALASRWLSGLG